MNILIEYQREHGLKNKEMADLLTCHLRHYENMKSGRRPITARYRRIIELMSSAG